MGLPCERAPLGTAIDHRKASYGFVPAFIGTAFAQDNADAARAQWRQVADHLRPPPPRARKLAELMDDAETDVLAYMVRPEKRLSV